MMPVDRIQELKDVIELVECGEISEDEALETLIEKGFERGYAQDQLWRAGFGSDPDEC